MKNVLNWITYLYASLYRSFSSTHHNVRYGHTHDTQRLSLSSCHVTWRLKGIISEVSTAVLGYWSIVSGLRSIVSGRRGSIVSGLRFIVSCRRGSTIIVVRLSTVFGRSTGHFCNWSAQNDLQLVRPFSCSQHQPSWVYV